MMKHWLRGLGLILLGFGGFMSIPGILVITGLVAVELDFFGIEIDTQRERLVWTVGFIISAAIGYVILRKLKDNDDEE